MSKKSYKNYLALLVEVVIKEKSFVLDHEKVTFDYSLLVSNKVIEVTNQIQVFNSPEFIKELYCIPSFKGVLF